MIKRLIKFLDKHRVILVLIILFMVSVLFLGVNSWMFWHHEFRAFDCDAEIDSDYCYKGEIKIFKDPEFALETFFRDNKELIDSFIKEYKLPEFSKHTAYFYAVTALINMNLYNGSEELYNFFNTYSNTYDLETFYIKNNFYYEIFYSYRIEIN